jgi:hypothetical protein
MSGTIPLLPMYAFIALTGTTLTVPLGLCVKMVRKCSGNIEDEDADLLELFSSSGGRMLYHFTFTVVRFQRTSSFVINGTSRGLWV